MQLHPLDIIIADRPSTMTLHTKTYPGDFSKYMIILKRFAESGGTPVAAWDGADAERSGIAATLDDANGFEILIVAKSKQPGPAKMRADLRIGSKYRFDHVITIPANEAVGWPVVMKDMVKTKAHNPEKGEKYGLCGDSLWWQLHGPAAPANSKAPQDEGRRTSESEERSARSDAERKAVAGDSPRAKEVWKS